MNTDQWIAEVSDGIRLLIAASPLLLLVELPLTGLLLIGVMRWWLRHQDHPPQDTHPTPRVSCVITCFNEGPGVARTLLSLCEQTYAGEIELLPVVDGAAANTDTLEAVRNFSIDPRVYPRRSIQPIAKWQRGGRVSSLNAGLTMATGEIVMALDGDTSFDNTMVTLMVRNFNDPCVVAVAGNIRVRNVWQSLVTALQALEYQLSIGMARIGLNQWNVINIISGASGAFRRNILIQIGGWDTHTSEDLDITLRLKNYISRHPYLRISFEPRAIGHTDVPATVPQFLRQRLRWDGDLLFLYTRKHWASLSPHLIGWRNFVVTVTHGLFVQILLPFMIIIDSYTLALRHSWPDICRLAISIYTVYLLLLTIQFIAMIGLCSERPAQDSRLMLLLPVFPIAMFAIRCWSAVAMLNEWWRRGHEESSMAPWWVIRRANRF